MRLLGTQPSSRGAEGLTGEPGTQGAWCQRSSPLTGGRLLEAGAGGRSQGARHSEAYRGCAGIGMTRLGDCLE